MLAVPNGRLLPKTGTGLRSARLCAVQWGGGLYIEGTATLTDSKVFSNEAHVRPPYAPSLTFILQRPAGTLRVLAFCMQAGAGLYVVGTATLTSTNVYENVAASVHLHFEPS